MYDTNGFLEKNRDPLPSDSIQLLSSCSRKLLQLFSKMLTQSEKGALSSVRHNPVSGVDTVRVNFEFISKPGVDYWCFHDRDIALHGKTIEVSQSLKFFNFTLLQFSEGIEV